MSLGLQSQQPTMLFVIVSPSQNFFCVLQYHESSSKAGTGTGREQCQAQRSEFAVQLSLLLWHLASSVDPQNIYLARKKEGGREKDFVVE